MDIRSTSVLDTQSALAEKRRSIYQFQEEYRL